MARITQYVCDQCGTRQPDDGYQPEGWCHAMSGDDLCPKCRRD